MAAETKIIVSAADNATPVIRRVEEELIGLRRRVDGLGSLAGGAALAGSLIGIGDAALQASIKMQKLEMAYATIAGSGKGATAQLEYLRQEAERLGLSYVDTAAQAKGFFSAVKGTKLEGATGKQIFSGVMEGAAALGLGTDEIQGMLLALSQMASKGKVQAEELRGQLGERLPGAFQIAARAMGMTTAELDKFMADGKLFAEDFLPKFAAQMHKEFGVASQNAATMAQAALNQLSSAWTEAKAAFSRTDTAVTGIRVVTEALKAFSEEYGRTSTGTEPLSRDVKDGLRSVVGYLDEGVVALGAWIVARKLATSETLRAFRADSQMLGVQGALRERLLVNNGAFYQRVTAERQAAKSALDTARADVTAATAAKEAALAKQQAAAAALAKAQSEERDAAAIGKSIGITSQQEAAFRRLIAAERAYAVAAAEAGAATNALSSAQTAQTGAAARFNAALRASAGAAVLTGLKNAASGLLGVLGGPWGAALTAAGVGLYAVYDRAQKSQAVIDGLAARFRDMGNSAEDAAGGLAKMDEALARSRQMAAQTASDKARDALKTATAAVDSYTSDFLGESGMKGGARRRAIEALVQYRKELDAGVDRTQALAHAQDALNEARRNFGAENPSLREAADLLGAMHQAVLESTTATERLRQAEEDVNKAAQQTHWTLEGITAVIVDATMKTAAFADAWNSLDPKKFASTVQHAEFSVLLGNLQGADKELARLLQSSGADPKSVQKTLSKKSGLMSEQELILRKLARDVHEQNEAKAAEQAVKKAGSGASRIENAQRSLEALRAEIDRLNGAGSAADVALTKKISEIEKIGQAARLSGTELSGLQSRYAEAFATDTLRKFDDELLKISGDAQAIRLHDIDRQMEDWRGQLEALRNVGQISAEDMAARLSAMRTALEKQADYKNLQTAAGFYRELGDLSGDYTLSIEKQNQLIAMQAEIHRQNGIPPELVAEWELLQKINQARDPLSGLQRAMRKTASESADMASQMGNAWTSMSKSMEDSIVRWGTTSKLTIEDVGNTMVEMLWRMAAQNIVTAPLNSMFGSLLGGLFGGGGGTSMMGNVPLYGGYAVARGGVLGGAGLSAYSGSIVSRPTLFSYATDGYGYNPPDRFARGAGLMGEAGPEAILPLTRTGGGELGVRAELPGYDGLSVALTSLASWRERQYADMRSSSFMAEFEAMLARRERQTASVERMTREGGAAAVARGAGGTPPARGEVTVNVYENTSKARAEVTQTPTANGTRIDVTIIDVVNRDIAQGGRTARTLQTAYGLKRKA